MQNILFFTVPEVELSVSNGDSGNSQAPRPRRFWFHILLFAFLHAINERGFPAPIQSHHKYT